MEGLTPFEIEVGTTEDSIRYICWKHKCTVDDVRDALDSYHKKTRHAVEEDECAPVWKLKSWDVAEARLLCDLLRQGFTDEQIADRLNRALDAVKIMRKYIDMGRQNSDDDN